MTSCSTIDIKGGLDGADSAIDGEARDLLRATYLKPLRDVEHELSPGYRSRLAQILRSHDVFRKVKDENGIMIDHLLEVIMQDANAKVESYFSPPPEDRTEIENSGFIISNKLTSYLNEFFHISEKRNPNFKISSVELLEVLKKLSLSIDENTSGLGSLNLLFIAMELLLLHDESHNGVRLALIEEIEAHLHPQAQLRLVKYLQRQSQKGQFILTTHSISLAASSKLEHVILCKNDQTYPMSIDYTMLAKDDYDFLERFLDATKANLFFAKGVLLVEGDAENILLPAIAEIIDRPLHKYGVSIVNVGSTAFMRYCKIFLRKNGEHLNIPVALVTDLDVRPIQYYIENQLEKIVYTVQDKNLDELNKLNVAIEFNKIKDQIYTSKSALNRAIDSIKKGKLSKENRQAILRICQVEIDEKSINYIRSKRKKHLCDTYQSGMTKLFVSNNWTLEYEIALSALKSELYQSILICDTQIGLEEAKEITNEFIEDASLAPDQLAYQIYDPLLKGEISKAAVAQQLAKILIDNPLNLSKLVKSDSNLAYLIKAIYHVTENEGELEHNEH
ncbi:ATP-dependent nuclease [Paenibacillus sedimenti]|uniref:AAA family ATPase n=1 Tax=Paenibacillus sedimenti TaxID=2770274 RepID=A0A926KZK4_9BACL|nr:TOPRIM nucleotidyl transferase/hydrolase domain-containing protein [Paenibacillus sedimenti]MBD0384845.1 AAA family ATPase [Paenibacillus sedimenti]